MTPINQYPECRDTPEYQRASDRYRAAKARGTAQERFEAERAYARFFGVDLPERPVVDAEQ